MSEPQQLLIHAFLDPLPEAEDYWRRWRAIVDLDKLDASSFCMLPALAGRMPYWIGEDPARDILLGICRRAWSQNQIRRRLLATALELLRSSGNEIAAAIGPLGWEQLYWPEGSVRTIDAVDIVVEPSSVRSSFEAFTRAGWSVYGRLPDWNSGAFFFAPAIRMRTASGEHIRLHWRDLPNTDFALRRPPAPQLERASTERDLVLALSGEFDGGLDWRCDALVICRRNLDWQLVAKLLRWRSRAKIRLEDLRRHWNVAVPQSLALELRRAPMERLAATPLRAYRHARRTILGSFEA